MKAKAEVEQAIRECVWDVIGKATSSAELAASPDLHKTRQDS